MFLLFVFVIVCDSPLTSSIVTSPSLSIAVASGEAVVFVSFVVVVVGFVVVESVSVMGAAAEEGGGGNKFNLEVGETVDDSFLGEERVVLDVSCMRQK